MCESDTTSLRINIEGRQKRLSDVLTQRSVGDFSGTVARGVNGINATGSIIIEGLERYQAVVAPNVPEAKQG